MYKEIIEKKFIGLDNLKFKFRSEAKDSWDNFLDSLKFGPVIYSNQELDYQELNRKEKKIFDTDLSLIVIFKNSPLVIFSFTLSKEHNRYCISSYGLPVLSPLFKDDLDNKIKEKLTLIFYEILYEIASYYKIENWISSEGFINEMNISFWRKISTKKGDKIFTLNEGYINISKSSEELIKHLRKKKIFIDIKRAKDLWVAHVRNNVTFNEWEKFKKLHIQVSGKQTRSDKTWESQFQDINNKKAFVIFLYDLKKLIGGAMYRYSKTTALYAIGAYDRNLFPKPISHLAHYEAINELKKKNINWLRMGDIPSKGDYNNPTEKEISIGLFKKKFSTDIFNKNIFIHGKNI